MKHWKRFMLAVALAVLFAGTATAQVLGPCGASPTKAKKGAKMEMKMPQMHASMQKMAQSGHRVLLPGDRAINFSLPAVVGNDIKTIKLSDYAGKWRVVCFYPGDFTFV